MKLKRNKPVSICDLGNGPYYPFFTSVYRQAKSVLKSRPNKTLKLHFCAVSTPVVVSLITRVKREKIAALYPNEAEHMRY